MQHHGLLRQLHHVELLCHKAVGLFLCGLVGGGWGFSIVCLRRCRLVLVLVVGRASGLCCGFLPCVCAVGGGFGRCRRGGVGNQCSHCLACGGQCCRLSRQCEHDGESHGCCGCYACPECCAALPRTLPGRVVAALRHSFVEVGEHFLVGVPLLWHVGMAEVAAEAVFLLRRRESVHEAAEQLLYVLSVVNIRFFHICLGV